MDDGEEQDKRMTRWHRFIQSYQTEFATEVNYITPPVRSGRIHKSSIYGVHKDKPGQSRSWREVNRLWDYYTCTANIPRTELVDNSWMRLVVCPHAKSILVANIKYQISNAVTKSGLKCCNPYFIVRPWITPIAKSFYNLTNPCA